MKKPLGEHWKFDECRVDWCDRPPRSRGLCIAHYSRWRRGSCMDKPFQRKSPRTRSICKIPNCERPVHCRGWCATHWQRWSKGTDMDKPIRQYRRQPQVCTVEGCERRTEARSMCKPCYHKWYKANMPMKSCTAAFCNRPAHARGLCDKHYRRLMRARKGKGTKVPFQDKDFAKQLKKGVVAADLEAARRFRTMGREMGISTKIKRHDHRRWHVIAVSE